MLSHPSHRRAPAVGKLSRRPRRHRVRLAVLCHPYVCSVKSRTQTLRSEQNAASPEKCARRGNASSSSSLLTLATKPSVLHANALTATTPTTSHDQTRDLLRKLTRGRGARGCRFAGRVVRGHVARHTGPLPISRSQVPWPCAVTLQLRRAQGAEGNSAQIFPAPV